MDKQKWNIFLSFIVGLIFSLGLAISGMTRPDVVIGFLDILGDWNPALLFVMLGAVGVHSTFYHLARHHDSPLLADRFHLPTRKEITSRLVVGSAIFGIGWGIAGYCPGPALTALPSLNTAPFLLIAGMIVGMLVAQQVNRLLDK